MKGQITHNDCETVYLSYDHAVAMQQAIQEMEKELCMKVDSIYVSPPIPDKGNWCDVMPTQTKYLLELGYRMGVILSNKI